jgi:hypothetical protein
MLFERDSNQTIQCCQELEDIDGNIVILMENVFFTQFEIGWSQLFQKYVCETVNNMLY